MYEEDSVRKATKKDWEAFISLIRVAKLPWLFIVIAFGLSILSSKVSVLFPDYSIQFFEAGDITRKTIATGIGLLVLAAVVSIIKSYIEARLRTGISMRLRDTVMDKIFVLRMPAIGGINPRELISRTSSDTTLLSDFLVTVLMVIAGEAFHFYFAMETIHGYHLTLFIFQLVYVPVSILTHVIQGHFTYSFQYRIQFRLARLTEYLSELLVNIPLIRIFTKEKEEIENGEDKIDRYAKVRVRSAALDTVFGIVDEVVRFGNRIFAILYGGYLVHKGELDIGTWMAYYMLVEQVSMNMELLTAQWAVLKGVQGAISRTAEIMSMEEEEYRGDPVETKDADLSLEDLEIRLGGKQILKGLTTRLERGESIAIVGSSGSGKSTLLNALIRFYEADEGRIAQGEQDIRETDLEKYRKQFSYVFQDVGLFSESLRYNLCYGAGRKVSDEEILRRCSQAGLDDFLARQENGLDSVITEGGSNISGGEMQRIGIVRALLRDGDILLFDEATSGLDAETESRVLKGMKDDISGKTVIMVAHRMGLIKAADHIIYLEDGKIVSEGTHTELMEKCSMYRQLVDAEKDIV